MLSNDRWDMASLGCSRRDFDEFRLRDVHIKILEEIAMGIRPTEILNRYDVVDVEVAVRKALDAHIQHRGLKCLAAILDARDQR